MIDIQRIVTLGEIFPVIGALGPRQCGKTKLAKQLGADLSIVAARGDAPRVPAGRSQPESALDKQLHHHAAGERPPCLGDQRPLGDDATVSVSPAQLLP